MNTGSLKTVALAAVALTATAPLHGALVAYYNMDDNVLDHSGLGQDGTLLAGATYSDDVPNRPPHVVKGKSLSLANGGGTENQGVRANGGADLASGVFSIAYWIKPTALQGNAGLERLTSRGGDAFETAIGDRNAVGGGDPLTLSYFQGGIGWQSTTTTVPMDAWTHVTWRNSGSGDGGIELLINGLSAFNGPGASAITGPAERTLTLGSRHNDVEGFEGLMDDVRFYDHVLTDEEVGRLIPEPSSLLLLMGGLGVSGLLRRNRR